MALRYSFNGYHQNTLSGDRFEGRIKVLSQKLDTQLAINASHENTIKHLQSRNEYLDEKARQKTISENNLQIKLAFMEREILDFRKVVENKDSTILKLSTSCEAAAKLIKILDQNNQELTEKLDFRKADDLILDTKNQKRMTYPVTETPITVEISVQTTEKIDSTLPIQHAITLNLTENTSSSELTPNTEDDWTLNSLWGGSEPISSTPKILRLTTGSERRTASESKLNRNRNTPNYPRLDDLPVTKKRNTDDESAVSVNSCNAIPNDAELAKTETLDLSEASLPDIPNRAINETISLIVKEMNESRQFLSEILENRLSLLRNDPLSDGQRNVCRVRMVNCAQQLTQMIFFLLHQNAVHTRPKSPK
ncbi:hypothetical protein Ciccas_000843 [Cichlidogyrus casuarinus]|uniref:Uncharacterized protein n=1 Tax=Cichlidogyrus casuarinus TaxID=1844966 RepID=A0ABD2QM30_9PLAT